MKKRFTITCFFACSLQVLFRNNLVSPLILVFSGILKRTIILGFWAYRQTLFHLTPKDGVYVWFVYYSNGKFKNNLTADAKSPLTTPQLVNYTNSARMRLKQFSIGWRKYIIGTPDAEKHWNLYGFAGFGLMFGKVQNTHSVVIDTALYNVPVRSGEGDFKRLTMDVGLGWEMPLGGDLFFYTEGKVWIPTTNYPSKYIFINNNAPFVATFGAGVRVLF
ncbi:MAG: hypothetical protein IPM04_14265 [Saprospiraceae bacterium]|nr:hypothetical protein [Candidatus Brachybacter algidus]MBK8748951.1 hypothetical protein [Candidatus Brachybacter algidus]